LKESDQVVLFTGFDVPECLRRLSESLDEKRWRPWGYAGSKEMLGKVTGHSFSFRPRRYADNLLAPTFYGRLYSQGGRTRIDGYFERPSWTSGLGDFRWMLAFTVVLALLFSVCLADALRGTVTPASLLGLIAFPTFVAYLARDTKRALRETREDLLDFLQKTLIAQIEPRR
jgi:hypothetical protein